MVTGPCLTESCLTSAALIRCAVDASTLNCLAILRTGARTFPSSTAHREKMARRASAGAAGCHATCPLRDGSRAPGVAGREAIRAFPRSYPLATIRYARGIKPDMRELRRSK